VSPTQKRPPEHPRTAAEGLGLAGRPWLRRLIGAGLVLHLTAVAMAPFAVLVVGREEPPGGGPQHPTLPGQDAAGAPGSDSTVRSVTHQPVIDRLEQVIRPYLDALYLNHGYSFFAPNPGPSFILEYEVSRPDGSVERGRLPDVEKHWPRLLYHRYFMLATQNPTLVPPPVAGGTARERPTDTLPHAILRHLMKLHGAERGVLRLYVHRLLWPEEVLRGKSPNDPDTYVFDDQIRIPPTNDQPEQSGPAGARAAEEVTP
jgi:hypothetical protein